MVLNGMNDTVLLHQKLMLLVQSLELSEHRPNAFVTGDGAGNIALPGNLRPQILFVGSNWLTSRVPPLVVQTLLFHTNCSLHLSVDDGIGTTRKHTRVISRCKSMATVKLSYRNLRPLNACTGNIQKGQGMLRVPAGYKTTEARTSFKLKT